MADYWTPETVASQRKFGTGLMQAGTDASPVGHWTQALARVLQGGVGGYTVGQANEGERQGKQAVADTWQQGLKNGLPIKSIAASLMGNPWGQEQGQDIAMKALQSEAQKATEREKLKYQLPLLEAQAEQARAHAAFYRSRAAQNNTPNAPTQESSADPLAGAGMNENGEIVRGGGGQPQQSFSVPDYVPQGGGTPTAPGVIVQGGNRFSPPMRLGGPMDDIERSMRLDEGRPQGVRVAQAGGAPALGGARPELMEQAISRFGRAGMTSPQIPGMVTDEGRNRRVDVPATREMQGQRAFSQASPDEQERLARFRQDQELWTGIYKAPPRAGYYYGPDGREMPKTDKNYKGDREQQAVALMNMNKVEDASKKLLSYNWLTRTALGAAGIGEINLAFADMKQGALGIAYALSGKTVAVAEMNNFMDAYGAKPGDSAETIIAKTQRMRQFYQALLTASRGGESYETAFARAMAATGLKNPDGTPAGAPAAASGGTTPRGQPAPSGSVRDLPTDELVRRLQGGR